ncbi:MAG TPA: tetratricopeptide repeat protein [Gammaproteobacteria bacterium]
MDVYSHEKEQIENIKAWWRENRWYIIAGLIISAAVVGGWRYWQEYRLQQAEAASQRYETLLTQAAASDAEAVAAAASELQRDYAGTPYASLGTLRLAALRVEAGEFDAAADALGWVMENTSDPELGLVARLRLARVLLQQRETADAQQVLDVANAGRFEALFEELRGDAFLLDGDRDNARVAYEAALAAMEPGLGDRRLVEMKLNNLALPQQVLAAEDAGREESAE